MAWSEVAVNELLEEPIGIWRVTAALPQGVTAWLVLDQTVDDLTVADDALNMSQNHTLSVSDQLDVNGQSTLSLSNGILNTDDNAIESGVSEINVPGWMSLGSAKLVVDGSNYTGGATSIVLIYSTNFVSFIPEANITLTGFAQGLSARVEQDAVNGTDWVQLIIE